jgi:diguanylate cyclase (GGDEF)-like protein
VVGAWISLYLAIRRRHIVWSYVILATSLLFVLVLFPLVAAEPYEIYQSYSPLIYALFMMLIVLSGVYGVPVVAAAAVFLYYLQFAIAYVLFSESPTVRLFLNGNYVLLFVGVAVVGYVVIRQNRLVGSMIRELLLTRAEKQQYEALSATDPLTGLHNRRYIESYIRTECDRVKRYGGTLSCLMIDVDRFKNINDNYGHLVGDEMLQAIARILQDRSRQSDVCARYGGEEFIIITPNETNGALVLAERIRTDIASLSLNVDGTAVQTTVSIGISGFDGNDDSAEELVNRADTALYRAKESGRNTAMTG